MSLNVPPSLIKQPKSVTKALRGIPHDGRLDFSFTIQDQGEKLASQAARSLLGATELMSETTGTDLMLRRKSSVLHKENFVEMLRNE